MAVAEGTPLRDVLFEQGVEFPCGGHGRCRGCRVRVLEGDAPITALQQERLSALELQAGWRLACQCLVTAGLTIELRQWDAAILANDTPLVFMPQEGLGVAVDVGTTTVVAQLLDLSAGHVLAVRTALNSQARFGSDVMSRVEYSVAQNGQAELEQLITSQIGHLIHQLLKAAQVRPEVLRKVMLVGNTVMHHLFCGLDLEPLSHYPFEPVSDGLQAFAAGDLGWELAGAPTVQFLPCLGSFVGSDILAGILATGLHESEELVALVDLGTNGEMVLGNRKRMLCASTAAGPAFEGARITAGMRASTGAIWKVTAIDGKLRCETLGNAPARGICGSGLVDAAAVGLELGLIGLTGRLANGAGRLPLCAEIALTQADIRQLQLAKAAIAAGLRLLLREWGAEPDEVQRLYLAGAFGNYVDQASARRIGLLGFPEEKVHPSGNTALLGAKIALFANDPEEATYESLRSIIEHVSLSDDPRFQDVYVEEMRFPPASIAADSRSEPSPSSPSPPTARSRP